MHNIFVSTTKVGKAPRACDGGNQVPPKGASILNHVDINENVIMIFLNIFKINKISMDQFFKISKDRDTPLIITHKKVGIDGKPNKKH